MRQSIVISIFSFLLSLLIALIYWVVRIGFLDNSFLIIVKVLGVSAFILTLPLCKVIFKKYSNEVTENVFFSDTILPIYGLIFISILGYFTPFSHINISVFFVLFGFVLLCIAAYYFVKDVQGWSKLFLIFVIGLFSIWIASVCWFTYLKPFILETWAYHEEKIDTLYHIALAQMIKTYGIPSTGLDGVVDMKYHWGSHWIFAQVSNFLNLPVIVIYQLFFPVVVAPLLFRTFLSFVMEVKKFSKPEENDRKLNIFFWIIFLAIFVGFFTNFLSGNELAFYSGGGTGLYLFMLLSESYTVSIIIMLGLLSVYLNFYFFKKRLTLVQNLILQILLLPSLIFILGLVKISTLFVVCCLLGYFFLRLKFFKETLPVVGMMLVTIASLIAVKIVFDNKEDHGGLEFLYFYSNKHINFVKFLLLFYVWSFIFIIIFSFKEKIYKTSFFQSLLSNKLIPIECIFVVSLAGLIPTFFLKINNFDALYFTEIQMWISSALVLAYIPFFVKTNNFGSKIFLFSIPCLALFIVFIVNTKTYFTSFFVECINTRQYLQNGQGNLTSQIKIAVANYKFQEILPILNKNNELIKKKYTNDKVLIFLQKLKNLDTLALKEKRKTLIYIDFRTLLRDTSYSWNLHCYNLPFVVPSLSGMAMIEGIDITYFDCGDCCANIGYSYPNYTKWKNIEQLNKIHTPLDLCERIRKEGFEKLIFYNRHSESFEKIDCNSL